MRMLVLEIRRMLSARLTCALLALSLLLAVVLAVVPVTFEYSTVMDEQGNLTELSGLRSIRYEAERQREITGEVTPAKIREALVRSQACLREYGVEFSYDLPEGVYDERIRPYAPLLHAVREAMADPQTGMAPSFMEIDPEEADTFYEACMRRMASLMAMEQKDHPAALRIAAAMYDRVSRPFELRSQSSSNAMEYLAFLAFLLVLLGTAIAAPAFSSDYQSGADDIQRCTRHGRAPLAVARSAAVFTLCAGTYAVCMCVHILLSNTLFGWACTETSIQMMYSVASLPDLRMGGLQICVAVGGLFSMLATVGMALAISSLCKNPMASLALSGAVCLLPMFVGIVIQGTAGTLLRCVLPSGGVELNGGYLSGLIGFGFLSLGSFCAWTPVVMFAACVLEIPAFCGLAVHGHSCAVR